MAYHIIVKEFRVIDTYCNIDVKSGTVDGDQVVQCLRCIYIITWKKYNSFKPKQIWIDSVCCQITI